jgi:uncharacterized protein YecE (DUF72 family)
LKNNKNIHIGTSGWHYDHWHGSFYPDEINKEAFLEYYAKFLNTVEINNTFYQMPTKKTLETWRDTVESDFIFSVKASRYITHMKKLREPEKSVDRFLERISFLRGKLGPILFQLPPHWSINIERLSSFLSFLPKKHRYTFEFRDESWFETEVYELLVEHNASFCIYDLDGCLSPKEITADYVYVRLHGPDGPYKGKYSKKQLAGWAGAFASWAQKVGEIYCYFDNDQAGFAAENAMELDAMLSQGS